MTVQANPPSSLPAEGDILVWPNEPQQLFLLMHEAGQRPADWQTLAQELARNFAQGAVVLLAEQAASSPALKGAAAAQALYERVRQWQAHAGLGFECTACIAQGAAAHTAITAAALHADLCARLFAVEGQALTEALSISDRTCLHWLQGDADVDALGLVREAVRQLQALRADCTLEVLSAAEADQAAATRQRILHLLQNYVPRRIWREALAHAQALDSD